MGYEVANDITSLWNELKLAYDKAVKENFARAPEIDAVFSVVENLRCSIMSVDAIAEKQTPHGPLSVDEIDELHTVLWSNVEAFDSISAHSKALFTWREIPVAWRGKEISNIVEAIRDEAIQYSMILRDCSKHDTFVPSLQLRELYPEPWFDLSAVQRIALKLRERLGAGGRKPNAKSGNGSKAIPEHRQYEKRDLRDLTKLGDTQINNYLKQFGMKPFPGGRPKKDNPHSMPEVEVIAFLEKLISDTNATEYVKSRCEKALISIQKP